MTPDRPQPGARVVVAPHAESLRPLAGRGGVVVPGPLSTWLARCPAVFVQFDYQQPGVSLLVPVAEIEVQA